MADGFGQHFDQFHDAQSNAGMGGAAGFFAALNVVGDMVGVNGIIGGAVRQDLATGAPLSNAEGNAQVIVGAFSLGTTFVGAGAAGAAGKAGSVAKGTGAASQGTAAAAGSTARTVATKVVSKTDGAAK
ncbi:MAG: hypothetical protein KF754_15860 [Planctomycetes bacterium]|nr:hypothetical protein [Planctomycetota bacterium]